MSQEWFVRCRLRTKTLTARQEKLTNKRTVKSNPCMDDMQRLLSKNLTALVYIGVILVLRCVTLMEFT